MSISAEHVQEFNQKGYVVVRGLYDATETQTISDWLDALKDSDGSESETATYFEESPTTGEPVLVRAEYLVGEHSPEITALFLKNSVIEALTTFLGDKPLLFKEKANYKLPGCRSDKLHQDQAAGWGAYSDYFVTMLIAIDENRVDNAAVSFRDSGERARDLLGPEWEVLSDEDPPFQPERDYRVIEAAPGDAVFFDCYVPHGSPANNTEFARRNMYLTFNRKADGDQRMAYYEDKWKNYPPNTRADARDRSSFKV